MSSRSRRMIELALKEAAGGSPSRNIPIISAKQLMTREKKHGEYQVDVIPSEDESVVSQNESESEDENNILQPEQTTLLVVSDENVEVEQSDIPIPAEEITVSTDTDSVVWEQSRFSGEKMFCNDTGPNVSEEIDTPLDTFLTVFPVKLLEYIAFQTNLYVVQKLGGCSNFQHTNIDEIKQFLAINLLMGIKVLPSYKDYWSSDPALRDQYIASEMSRNRFSWLLSNIHLNDNDKQPKKGEYNYDKLYKVRPLLDILSESFECSYKSSCKQTVDESMIRFKGRSSIKQYMPQKPIKRGYKVWVRANENGYISQFQIYTGKVADSIEKNLGARIVKEMTQVLHGKNHQVYMDNYFSSLPLMKYLLQNQVCACGTVRQGRLGMPKDFSTNKHLQRGEFQFQCSQEGIVALQWKDKKPILFLSNFHDIDSVSTVNRKNKDGTISKISCPQIVKDYNANMGHVDKADMLKTCYEINRRSKKWWHRIMWHFLDVAVVNSCLIFQERSEESISLSLKEFRLAVISGLIGASKSPRGAKASIKTQSAYKPYVALEKRLDKAAHMPKKGTSRRCAFCSTRAQPHRTRWYCATCGV